MASYTEHIAQAKKNLSFIEQINYIEDSWDWKVTVCFYVAVHLVNAHLAVKANLHYRKHIDVNDAINPFGTDNQSTQIPADIFKCYMKLQGLSKRSRYLCHQDLNAGNENAPDTNITVQHITYDKHFAKAIKQLNKFLEFFAKQYGIHFEPIIVSCTELRGAKLAYFQISELPPKS